MAIYYVYSAAVGSGNGSSWANAFTTLTLAFATEVAGDTLYVAHDHAQTLAGSVTLASSGTTGNPTRIICVNRAGSVPPVSADRRATATVSTTGNNGIDFSGTAHYDGIIFTSGNSGGTAHINLTAASSWIRFDNCSLRLGSTGTLNRILVGGNGSLYEWNNTTVSFAQVNQGIGICGALKWRNTASALLGTISTAGTLQGASTRGGNVECIGVDLSAAGSGKTLCTAHDTGDMAVYKFVDCKLNASVTKASVPTGPGSGEMYFIRSGASGVNYTVYCQRMSGSLIEETTIVRTGGATDGTTPISWKVVTSANCTYSATFDCPTIAIWNDTTGSAKTATIEGVWGGGSVPNDDDVWVDLEYLGDASSPMGSFVNDGKVDLLATAAGQTSSSATWGGSTTKFKLAVTFTAQQKGWIYCRVKVAKASTTVYIDPLCVLS